MEYLVKQRDDSPLYLFESALEDRNEGKKIVKRFEVPKFFKDEDYFKIVNLFIVTQSRWVKIKDHHSVGF
jgi:hypothetical protein